MNVILDLRLFLLTAAWRGLGLYGRLLMTEPTAEKPLHPLRSRQLKLIGEWKDWLALWETEIHAERLVELLHIGFRVQYREYEEAEQQFLLYLALADGHTEPIGSWEELRADTMSYTTFGPNQNWAKIRQQIAQKAFKELCRSLFENTTERPEGPPSWVQPLVRFPRVFDAILTLFLPIDTFEPTLRNLPRERKGHDCETAGTFLRKLSILAWKPDTLEDYGYDADQRKTFHERRPQFVRILAGLGELRLFSEGHRFVKLELDEKDCEMLEKIALGTKLDLPTPPNWSSEHRLPETLEEAVAGGSRAAQLLLIERAAGRQKKRFAKLRELASRRERTEAEMQKLSAPCGSQPDK